LVWNISMPLRLVTVSLLTNRCIESRALLQRVNEILLAFYTPSV